MRVRFAFDARMSHIVGHAEASGMLEKWKFLRRLAVSLSAIGALVTFVGCGSSSDRLAISGEVTLDGVPLGSGSIRFTSLESQKLLASGAVIQNGRYSIPAKKGLWPGTYRVEMSSPDLAAPPVMVRDTPDSMGIPAAPDRIPPEYNVNSEKTIVVTIDGDNHFVFDIASRSLK
jgi:hypothetical protein